MALKKRQRLRTSLPLAIAVPSYYYYWCYCCCLLLLTTTRTTTPWLSHVAAFSVPLREPPRMFVESPPPPRWSVQTTMDSSFRTNWPTATTIEGVERAPRHSRGTLGFDVFCLSAYSRHHTTTTSTIDTTSWNQNKQQTIRLVQKPLSREHLQKRTVAQLKEELSARNLKKSGNKADLVQRLWRYEQEQLSKQHNELSSLGLHAAYGTNHRVDRLPEIQSWDIADYALDDEHRHQQQRQGEKGGSEEDTASSSDTNTLSDTSPNSLAEWARTVDLEPLMKRRQAIRHEKLHGKPKQTKKNQKVLPREVRANLQKVFDQPSSSYSNRQVQQLYETAKKADQMGDRALSKRILLELKTATPNDARIYKRLARFEQEEGNVEAARTILETATDLFPTNAYLWHGLANLEGSIGNTDLQIQNYHRAIEVDASLPHSYHALGTLLHTRGEIASAVKILKRGIEYCPTNHRLHHALGDLYRDAKMLDMATKSYRKALKCGPPVSHGFAYTALAYVCYEQGQVDRCRQWLHRSVQLSKGRHANGWVSLAQFEESLGNIDAARSACISGIALYERGLLDRLSSSKLNLDERSLLEDPVELRNKLLRTVPQYRSGDRFFNVYRNWARLEERHGTIDSFEEVYERAMLAFPKQYKIALDAAEYYIKICMHDRARLRFADACRISNHAEPYRLFAKFEMSNGNYQQAQRILYSGAMKMLESNHQQGLAQLFYTWAVCEWHLDNLRRAETLFEYALDEVTAGKVSRLRSVILFSRAKFEYYREEYIRAQHYVGLCLQENLLPGGSAPIWELWQDIALAQKNISFARECEKESIKAELDAEPYLSDIKVSMRKDPWHHSLFGYGPKDLLLELPGDS